jgi:hypothetical protein
VGENPIKIEWAFELISVPETTSVDNEITSLSVNANDFLALGTNLQCGSSDIDDILAVSYLFARQSTNTNGNDMLIVRREYRNGSWTTRCVRRYFGDDRHHVLSNFFF